MVVVWVGMLVCIYAHVHVWPCLSEQHLSVCTGMDCNTQLYCGDMATNPTLFQRFGSGGFSQIHSGN